MLYDLSPFVTMPLRVTLVSGQVGRRRQVTECFHARTSMSIPLGSVGQPRVCCGR
jgi:hypothetical protein